ncbi:Guanine nucleotide-binding protein subunit alpha-13 [Blomia tropicalis]|nr:Guanine nucleotide-binding protein subunit alpha-13 [Blomia tropicalis]
MNKTNIINEANTWVQVKIVPSSTLHTWSGHVAQSERPNEMGNCLIPDFERRTRLKSEKVFSGKCKESRKVGCGLNSYQDEKCNIFKILILGTGESGKSTLVKQMKIIHNEGYSEDEILQFRPIILDNLVSSMKYVVTGMRLLDISFQHANNKNLAKKLIVCDKYFDEDIILFPHLEKSLKTLWNDTGVKEAVARGFEYELNDSALYEVIICVKMTDYVRRNTVPNTKDVLKSRVRTIGVAETEFRIDKLVIRMFDVGGQRSERRKWIQCFDDVRALLFVVAISEYDMTLIEDCDRNRLRESLQLFDSVCSNVLFRNTVTILFLNKLDLFREKILFTDRQLKYFITEYTGPDYDPDLAALFIEQQFRKLAFVANCNKPLFTHFTTATDTTNVKNTFNSVVDIIIRENLQQSTLL